MLTRFMLGFIGLVMAGPGLLEPGELPADFAEMRSAICDSAPTKDGCAKCPAYMGETMSEPLKFNSYVEGRFTAADTDEVLLTSMMSCYSHADGFSSAVLLRRMSGKWERIAFYHNEMELTGHCRKIPGPTHQKDLLLCEFSDWGSGSVAVISLDSKGGIASRQELVAEWQIPFRELNPTICSTQLARINEVSSDAIELSIQTQTFVPSPDCSDEKYEKFIARFTRNNGRFEPTAATRDFLKRNDKRPD